MAESHSSLVESLAETIRDAYLAAYVRRNPSHDNPAFAEVKGMGMLGWEAVAAEMLAMGFKAPDGFLVGKWKQKQKDESLAAWRKRQEQEEKDA